LLCYRGLLVTEALLNTFAEQYYCPTALRLSSLDYKDAAGGAVEMSIIGDPQQPGAVINDGRYARVQSLSPRRIVTVLWRRCATSLLTSLALLCMCGVANCSLESICPEQVAHVMKACADDPTKFEVSAQVAMVYALPNKRFTAGTELLIDYGECDFWHRLETEEEHCVRCFSRAHSSDNPLVMCGSDECRKARHRLCFRNPPSVAEVESDSVQYFCADHWHASAPAVAAASGAPAPATSSFAHMVRTPPPKATGTAAMVTPTSGSSELFRSPAPATPASLHHVFTPCSEAPSAAASPLAAAAAARPAAAATSSRRSLDFDVTSRPLPKKARMFYLPHARAAARPRPSFVSSLAGIAEEEEAAIIGGDGGFDMADGESVMRPTLFQEPESTYLEDEDLTEDLDHLSLGSSDSSSDSSSSASNSGSESCGEDNSARVSSKGARSVGRRSHADPEPLAEASSLPPLSIRKAKEAKALPLYESTYAEPTAVQIQLLDTELMEYAGAKYWFVPVRMRKGTASRKMRKAAPVASALPDATAAAAAAGAAAAAADGSASAAAADAPGETDASGKEATRNRWRDAHSLAHDWAEYRSCCGQESPELLVSLYRSRLQHRKAAPTREAFDAMIQQELQNIDHKAPRPKMNYNGKSVCVSCYRALTGMGHNHLRVLRTRVRLGPGAKQKRTVRCAVQRDRAVDLLLAYLHLDGQHAPNPRSGNAERRLVIVSHTRKQELLDALKDHEFESTGVPSTLSISALRRALIYLKKEHFLTISTARRKQISRCDDCERLNNQIAQARAQKKIKFMLYYQQQRDSHFEAMRKQRAFFDQNKKEAIQRPDSLWCITLDGMDQVRTVPLLLSTPCHVCRCLAHRCVLVASFRPRPSCLPACASPRSWRLRSACLSTSSARSASAARCP
jgi:hypothetical protein